MSEEFILNAESRNDMGKGASRRLRRLGRVPAIMYGGEEPALNLALDHNEIIHQLENEAFYSSILNVKIGGRSEPAILRDLQRHPFKPAVLHVDLQRVSENQPIRVHVPLHFVNEASCRGVKQEGGVISHLLIEAEVTCLPRYLPEFIEVDMADLGIGESIHLSELKLPEGVELVQLAHGGEEYDTVVVNVHHARVSVAAGEGEPTEEEAGGMVPEQGTGE